MNTFRLKKKENLSGEKKIFLFVLKFYCTMGSSAVSLPNHAFIGQA